MTRLTRALAGLSLSLVLSGCGSEAAELDEGQGAAQLCTGVPPEGVRVDEWILEVPPPPPNPVTGEATPPELDKVRVLRYRRDPPVDQVEAVVVFLPGGNAGAMTAEPLARQVVARASGPVEVWAIDRRQNFLEDLRGMQAAEAARDPGVADGYYFGGAKIDGQSFRPLPAQGELGFMSEWGLVSFIADLRAVIGHVPQGRRATNLFLAGHSLGAIQSEIAAAWDIGGKALASELAGLILVDGSISGVGVDRDTYYEKGIPDPYSAAGGLDAIRSGKAERATSLFGSDHTLLAAMEILGMRAYWRPEEISPDDRLGGFLSLLYGFRPKASNAALLGLTLDDDYSPAGDFSVDVGRARGGPFARVESGPLQYPFQVPTQPDAVYTWEDGKEQKTCVRTLARCLFEGPANFMEWAFPARFDLDWQAVQDLSVSTDGGDYRFDQEKLLVTRAAEVDPPVLAIACQNQWFAGATQFEPFRERIAPVARNGASRDLEAGFRLMVLEGWTHVDPLLSAQTEPTASILEFVEANRSGSVDLSGLGKP